MEHIRPRPCTLRIAFAGAGIKATSLDADPGEHAPWCGTTPAALPIPVKPLMPAAVAQRLLGLAAVALLGGLIALAVIEQRGGSAAASPTPTGAIAAGGGWYSALAASRGPAGDAERTTCGLILTTKSFGVTHPVLPCGAKLLLRFGGQTVLTEVIDNRLKSAGRQFELTERLAVQLGIDGTQEIDWRFAARPAE